MTTPVIYTDIQLAELFGLSRDKFHDLRRRHSWPFLKLSRTDIRFTEAHLARIIEIESVTPDPSSQALAADTGLTPRSAARSVRRAS